MRNPNPLNPEMGWGGARTTARMIIQAPLPCTFIRNRRLVGHMFGYFSVTAEEHAQNTHITVRYVYVRPHSPRYNRPVHVSLPTHAGGQPSRSTGSELALCSVANTLPKFRAPTDQQSSSSSYQKKEKKQQRSSRY